MGKKKGKEVVRWGGKAGGGEKPEEVVMQMDMFRRLDLSFELGNLRACEMWIEHHALDWIDRASG